MCLVTRKLVKLTKYAREELKKRYQISLTSFLARSIVIPTTFSSIIRVAGSKHVTAIGAMYSSKFMEFSLSLEKNQKSKKLGIVQRQIIIKLWCKKEKGENCYPSEESKISWSTDLNALAAVAVTHIINPKRWKLGSPCNEIKVYVKQRISIGHSRFQFNLQKKSNWKFAPLSDYMLISTRLIHNEKLKGTFAFYMMMTRLILHDQIV